MSKSICAVVVTYNRKSLLLETLQALIKQSQPLSGIFIVDNASTDGTEKILYEKNFIEELPDISSLDEPIYLEKILEETKIKIHYVRMIENLGGAGGFSYGIKESYRFGYDFMWIMDDDVIPEKDALHNLLIANNSIKHEVGFLCSRVVGENYVSMNVPEIDYRMGKNYYPTWEDNLHLGCVKLRHSTFVSVLIPRKVIEEVGYPISEMFIWGDDLEYTTRISENYPCYLVGNSVVVHKRKIQKGLDLREEKDPKRITNFFYFFRNTLYVKRKFYPKKTFIKYYLNTIIYILLLLKSKHRFKKISVVVKALYNGLKFNPKIEKP